VAAPPPVYSKGEINRAGQGLRSIDRGLHGGDEVALTLLRKGRLDADLLLIDTWRSQHARPLVRVNAGLRHYIRKAGADGAQVSQRLKRLSTIVDKLSRQSNMELSRMEDIGGVRVILPQQSYVDAVVESIERARGWSVRRVRRYVEGGVPGPKDDGYRAVHVVVIKDGYHVEIQFRTPVQDSWAQSVEQDTRRLGSALKFGGGPTELREYYKLVSEYFALREQNLEAPQDLMEQLAKSYAATSQYFAEGSSERRRLS
jgi:putative GTP pyrophosphokinase